MSLSDEDGPHRGTSESEDRPIKKARYIWQIKGRCRLNQNRHRICKDVGCSQNASTPSCSSASSSHCSASPPCAASSAAVSSYDRKLKVWQARLMAKAVVDNTVNQVIEDGGLASYVDEANAWLDNSFATRDSANLENAAVMMAIQSHGLQHPQKCTCPEPSAEQQMSARVELSLPFHHRQPSRIVNSLFDAVSSRISEKRNATPSQGCTSTLSVAGSTASTSQESLTESQASSNTLQESISTSDEALQKQLASVKPLQEPFTAILASEEGLQESLATQKPLTATSEEGLQESLASGKQLQEHLSTSSASGKQLQEHLSTSSASGKALLETSTTSLAPNSKTTPESPTPPAPTSAEDLVLLSTTNTSTKISQQSLTASQSTPAEGFSTATTDCLASLSTVETLQTTTTTSAEYLPSFSTVRTSSADFQHTGPSVSTETTLSKSSQTTKSNTMSSNFKRDKRLAQSSFEFDFLEQAVATAILKKGLITTTTTSSSTGHQ